MGNPFLLPRKKKKWRKGGRRSLTHQLIVFLHLLASSHDFDVEDALTFKGQIDDATSGHSSGKRRVYVVPRRVRIDADATARQHDKVLHWKFCESIRIDALTVDRVRAKEERVGLRVNRLQFIDGCFSRSETEATVNETRFLQPGPDTLQSTRMFRVSVVITAHALKYNSINFNSTFF